MIPAKVVKTSADMSRISEANPDRMGTASGVFTVGRSLALGSLARGRAARRHRLGGRRGVHRPAVLGKGEYANAPQDREDEHGDPEIGDLTGRLEPGAEGHR